MKGHSFGLVSTKNETRVSNAEAKRSDNNQAKAIVNPSKLYRGKQIWYLHSLKTNKEALICDQIRVNVALAQLVTTVYATREDEKNRGTQEAQKDAHSCSQRWRGLFADIASHVVDEQGAEEEQAADLEPQTSHGNIDTGLTTARADYRYGTTGSLENKAHDIERDEDPIE